MHTETLIRAGRPRPYTLHKPMTEQELLQVPEELRELFIALDKQGLNPQMCDTLVPYYANGVPCGTPNEVGDICHDEFDLMPRDMVALNQTYTFNAYGDSMVGAGIDHGDRLEMLSTPVARHGDIVLASVGDGYTVKSYFVDDLGRAWLVPANDKYKAMLITEERRVRIEGRVISVRKMDPRADNRAMRNAVLASEEYAPTHYLSKAERTEQAIRSVAPRVMQKRQWYAVYRALLDQRAVEKDAYADFVQRVHDAVPEHAHLPSVVELRRMEVQSFRRCVEGWDRDNAPVTGTRFDAYLQIARATTEAWEA